MWNGSKVVRVSGKPDLVRELVILDRSHQSRYRRRLFNLKDAVENGVLKCSEKVSTKELQELTEQPANIRLNVQKSTTSTRELWICAAFGTLAQGAAVAFPAVTVYRWKWLKGPRMVASYAYPCFSIGTLAITIGLILCSHVIEGSTKELTFMPTMPVKHILRLQKSCTISDQDFSSYGIFNKCDQKSVRTSRLARKKYYR